MAEPEAATTKQQVYRMSMYFKKKKDITEEEFNRHWSEVHGPLVRPLLEKYGCLRYTQYHTPSTARGEGARLWGQRKNMQLLEFDGVAEFLVTSPQILHNARQDPYYNEKVYPDEQKFLDFEHVAWTIGYEEVHVQDGKVVPLYT